MTSRLGLLLVIHTGEVARLFDQEGALAGEAFGRTGSRDLNWVDRMSLCAGLQWHIGGSTVILETAEERKNKK